MKANQPYLRFEEDTNAVTAVLGAILVVALLVALLVTVRIQWVPVWESDAEASHMLEVSQQLAGFKAQIDRQAGNATQVGEISSEVLLGTTRSSLFAQNRLPGTLEFESGADSGAAFNLSAARLTVILTNGTLVPIADNEWEDIPATTEVDDVQQVVALRLRIDEMDSSKVGETVAIQLTNAAGASQGRFEVTVDSAPSQYLPTYSTYNAAGELLTQVSTTYHIATSFTPFYVNALEPEFVFDQVLAAADKPMKVTLTHTADMPADYSIAYLKSDGTGQSVLVGGGGALKSPYLQSFTTGTLTYTARNSFYVPQTYVVENGAIILDQGNGAAFKVPPNFQVTEVLGTAGVTLTLPMLTGDSSTVAGPRSATLFTSPRSSTVIQGLSPQLNFSVATSYPDLWEDFFIQELESAGFSASGAEPEFDVSKTSNSVTLRLFGPDSDPASTDNDISMQLTQANVRLRIES